MGSSVFSKPAAGPVPGPQGARPGPQPAQPGGKPSSAFRRAADALEGRRPARVVTLPVSAWVPDYAPREDVLVGLRIYSEAEAVEARAAAAGRAWKLHPQDADEEERVTAGNGALMAWLVARCATKPADRTVRFFGSAQGGAEDVVPIALTPGGLEFLFGELEALVAAENPTAPEADDEDIIWLIERLNNRALDGIGAVEVRRARRLLASAISWMRDGDDEG